MSVSRAGGLDLETIAARLKAATPGPWSTGPCSSGGLILQRGPGEVAPLRERHAQPFLQVVPSTDAELIAHAPDDIAALLDEVRALRTALRPFIHDVPAYVQDGDVVEVRHRVGDLRRAAAVLGAPERDLNPTKIESGGTPQP